MILHFVHDYKYEYVDRPIEQLGHHRGYNCIPWDSPRFTGIREGYVLTLGVL